MPVYAQLPTEALEEVERWLDDDEDVTEQRLGDLFERFEAEQPVLAARIGDVLARTEDEVAMALGYFLCLVIWMAFEQRFGRELCKITRTDLRSVEEALDLDEQLRGADPAEAVDSDDVVAMEQPHIMQFVHQHIDAALDVHAEAVDVDAVHRVYRLVLVELLALSYAVMPPEGFVGATTEIYA